MKDYLLPLVVFFLGLRMVQRSYAMPLRSIWYSNMISGILLGILLMVLAVLHATNILRLF